MVLLTNDTGYFFMLLLDICTLLLIKISVQIFFPLKNCLSLLLIYASYNLFYPTVLVKYFLSICDFSFFSSVSLPYQFYLWWSLVYEFVSFRVCAVCLQFKKLLKIFRSRDFLQYYILEYLQFWLLHLDLWFISSYFLHTIILFQQRIHD